MKNKKSDKTIVSEMTLNEKVRLLVGMGMQLPKELPEGQIEGLENRGAVIGSIQNIVPGAAGATASIERLGIPAIVVADGPAGLRIASDRPNDTKTYFATAYPIASLLASTWNTDLVYNIGKEMGQEAKAYGIDIILAPALNIQRNILGGRNFEYYSEDPFVTGKMASAIVRGIQSNGVGASIKHFAANNQETNRETINVKVSERALREIYLAGFEMAVKEANPWTVMTSYNKINGVYTSESEELLNKILRCGWGFKGGVMTDWFGGFNPVQQMKAGNDLLMPGTKNQLKKIIDAVKQGVLKEDVLDENVSRVLGLIRKSLSFKGYRATGQPDLKKHAETARRSATQGMVLLKNENSALPLKNAKTIAAFGVHSYKLISGGTGSGEVNKAYVISLKEGLKNAGFSIDKSVELIYEKYLSSEKEKQTAKHSFLMPDPIIPEMPVSGHAISSFVSADIAIITIGRVSGEFADRQIKNDYCLSKTEFELIDNVSEVFHTAGKKVVVILNVGGVIEVASWRDKVDAILLAWLPGQEAGNAIADILSAKVNPSGKLATTFLKKYEDEGSSAKFPGKEYGQEITLGLRKVRLAEIEYSEGIYVGYRAFDKQKINPAYEFGFGLSYTDFDYRNLVLSSPEFRGEMKVNITIKNTGQIPGREIVQVYLSAPGKTMDKPLQELKGFACTRLLRPDETQTLDFVLDARSLASFDEKNAMWVSEKGDYIIRVGSSSRNIRLQAGFNLPEKIIVEKIKRD